MAKKTERKQEKVEKKVRLVRARGRTFEGTVTKKFPTRVVIEFEKTFYVPKYERYYKKKTRLHAHLPENLFKDIHIGDYIKIRECRPLSKIIHFVVIKKISSAKDNPEAEELMKKDKEEEIEKQKKVNKK